MGGGKREGKNHVGPGGDGQEKVIKSQPHSGSQEWAQGQHVRILEGDSKASVTPAANGLAPTKGSHVRLLVSSLTPREAEPRGTEGPTGT